MTKLNCLVIGGSGALGEAICHTLEREKAQVAFTYHQNKEKAEEISKSLTEAIALHCDLRDISQIKQTVAEAQTKLGQLHSLILAVGTSGRDYFYEDSEDTFLQITAEDFDDMISINTKGVFYACQAALPFLKEQGGNIVVIGAMDCVRSIPSPIHFAASKAALVGVVESLSKAVGKYNVCVNIVAPGILEEGVSTKLSATQKENYLQHCSLSRFGSAREIAEVVCWFALENTYITGQSILLDGGL